jgi:integrase
MAFDYCNVSAMNIETAENVGLPQTETVEPPRKYATTRSQLSLVGNGLYRHVNGSYYACKYVQGKPRWKSLKTSDRKIAERIQRDWLANLNQVDTEAERTTLRQLIDKLLASRAGLAPKTVETETWLADTLRKTWDNDLDIQVSQIRPSMLNTWLAKHESRLKNSSYNAFTGFLNKLFELAVGDKMISKSENPYDGIRKPWKSPRKTAKKRLVPTDEQFAALVASIRNETQNFYAQESANFIEFMGLAGLGQAEASSLTWGDVLWDKAPQGELSVRRKKTGEPFPVPMYRRLKPFLQRLYEAAHKDGRAPSPETKLFTILDARKSLTNACKRLGFPAFSQRSIRAYLIRTLWRAKIDVKLISKWQGHQDGGKLILATYTEVFGADDDEYVSAELSKLA